MFTTKQRVMMSTLALLKEMLWAKENIYKEACKPLINKGKISQ